MPTSEVTEMTGLQSTTNIYNEFERMVHEILGENEIDCLAQIPGEDPILQKNLNRDELNYVSAYMALAKSADVLGEDEGQAFRYFAKIAIRKASKKISKNRRRVLLHTICISNVFSQRNLPNFLIILFEEDQII